MKFIAFKKTLLLGIAILLLIVGVILMFTPMPGSILIIAVALTLIISTSHVAAFCIQFFRSKFSLINRVFIFLESRTKGKMKSILARTDPKHLRKNETHHDFVVREKSSYLEKNRKH